MLRSSQVRWIIAAAAAVVLAMGMLACGGEPVIAPTTAPVAADPYRHAGSDNGCAHEYTRPNCDGCAYSNPTAYRNAAAHCDAHTDANTDTANGHAAAHGDAPSHTNSYCATDTHCHAAAHADAASYGWPGPRAAQHLPAVGRSGS